MIKNHHLSIYTSLSFKDNKKRDNFIFIFSLLLSTLIIISFHNIYKNTTNRSIPNWWSTRILETTLLIAFIFTCLTTNYSYYFNFYSRNSTIKNNIYIIFITSITLISGMTILKLILIKFNLHQFPLNSQFINFNKLLNMKSIEYIFTSFIQEFLLRYYVHLNLKKMLINYKNSSAIAIALTSILFAVSHLHYGLILPLASIVYISITGYIYEKNHSLFTVTIIHFIVGRFAALLYFFS